MGVAPTVAMGPLANVSISNFACNISNYLCTNFGAFIKKCTIDQFIRCTIHDFFGNKNFVSGFVSNKDFVIKAKVTKILFPVLLVVLLVILLVVLLAVLIAVLLVVCI